MNRRACLLALLAPLLPRLRARAEWFVVACHRHQSRAVFDGISAFTDGSRMCVIRVTHDGVTREYRYAWPPLVGASK